MSAVSVPTTTAIGTAFQARVWTVRIDPHRTPVSSQKAYSLMDNIQYPRKPLPIRVGCREKQDVPHMQACYVNPRPDHKIESSSSCTYPIEIQLPDERSKLHCQKTLFGRALIPFVDL